MFNNKILTLYILSIYNTFILWKLVKILNGASV